MSMSTHVIAFKPADEVWRKHKAVWDACDAAGVPTPKDTVDYFEDMEPDIAGVRVEIEDTPSCVEWSDDMERGFEIHIDKLPKDVKIVRVYNSW